MPLSFTGDRSLCSDSVSGGKAATVRESCAQLEKV